MAKLKSVSSLGHPDLELPDGEWPMTDLTALDWGDTVVLVLDDEVRGHGADAWGVYIELSWMDAVRLAVECLVHREMPDPRHRGDLAFDPAAVDHEEGLNQVPGGQLVLAHESTQRLGATAAAGTLPRGGNHDGRLGSAGTHCNHA